MLRQLVSIPFTLSQSSSSSSSNSWKYLLKLRIKYLLKLRINQQYHLLPFTAGKFTERNDGKVVEDIGYNLKAVVESCYSTSIVPSNSIVYDPSDNANRISFAYEDEGKSKSTGKIELFVNSKKVKENKDSFYTLVNQRQSSVRRRSDVIDQNGGLKQAASQIIADYAIEYDLQLSLPPIQKDVNIEKETLTGTMRIMSYLQPQDSLYFLSPDQPVASFKYDVRMTKRE